MNRSKVARLLIGSAILALLVLISAFGSVAFWSKPGIEIVFQAQPLIYGSGFVTDDQLNQTRAAIETRLTNMSANQFKVRLQGSDRLVADVVGKTDPEATANVLVQQGFIEFLDSGSSCLSPGTRISTGVYHTYFIGADIDPNSIQDGLDPIFGTPQVTFSLKGLITPNISRFSTSQMDRYLAVTLDHQVIICFNIQLPLTNQKMILSGLQSVPEARKLSFFLKSGSLPIHLTTVESKSVDNLDLNATMPAASTSSLVAQPLIQRGVELVFQAQPLSSSGSVTADQLDQARAIVENRLGGLAVSQHKVSTEGNNRIAVQFAGVANVDQLAAALSQPGLLEFIDAGDQPLSPGTMVQTSSSGVPLTAPGIVPGTTPTLTPTNKVYPAVVTSADLDTTGISLQFDQLGQAQVAFKLRSAGAKKLADFTAAHVGKYMPIVLDKKVITSPVIQATIIDGVGVINNLSSVDEAKQLSATLKYGTLPVRLSLVENKVVADLALPTTTPLVALATPTPVAVSTTLQRGLDLGIIIGISVVGVLLIAFIAFLTLRRSRRLQRASNLPPIAWRIIYSAGMTRAVALHSCLVPRASLLTL